MYKTVGESVETVLALKPLVANAGFDKHTISPSHRIAVPMRKDGAITDAGHGNSGNADEGAEHL